MKKIKINSLSAILLWLSAALAHATPVTFGFSGEVSWDYSDVPVGTILYGSITYDSSSSLVDIGLNHSGYLIDNLTLIVGGDEVTHSGGSLQISGNTVSIDSGPYNSFGGGNDFSDSVLSGTEVRGFGVDMEGLPVADVLPDDPASFYGLGGTFYINRSGGNLYDVNSLADLKIPSALQTHTVKNPGTLALFLFGLLAVSGIWFRRKNYYQSGVLKGFKL